MSIATEITRLQGIKTNIRNALVTQGISQAISHNMADFSADILAIQGGSEGVYITVTCDSAYQGYDIILSANESELDRKQCPSSSIVNFFVSADNVTLPATFTISNNHPDYSGMTATFETFDVYGWYETTLSAYIEPVALVPVMTSNTTPSGECGGSSDYGGTYKYYYAFNKDNENISSWDSNSRWMATTAMDNYLYYNFNKSVTVKKLKIVLVDTQNPAFKVIATNDISKPVNEWDVLYSSEKLSGEAFHEIDLGNQNKAYQCYGILQTENGYMSVRYLQFYGY